MRPRLAAALGACLLYATPAAAQIAEKAAPAVPQTFDWWEAAGVPSTTPWGQPIDVASTERIRSWTTMPEYTNPLVDHLIEDPVVVSPTDHFGEPIGAPGVLHKVDEIYGYFEALAASSPRVNFQRLGETEEGNHFALVQVGSEENLARLEAIKAGLNTLADPRGVSEGDARRLIDELPAVYTIIAGLHSTETGPSEMVMELAYRLAVSDAPMIRAIRDNVVVFIVPVAEVDGRNRVVDWHRRYNRDVYDADDRVPGPPYWGKYIFHDNNRDGLQMASRLTQEIVSLFLDWRFPIIHDLHESVPYMYISTGTGPYNPAIDPITVSEWQWYANYEVTALTAEGMPGVWTHGFYDGWYPGYLIWVAGNDHNAMGRFYETFGNSIPNTMERTVGRQTSVEWYRPNPPRDTTLWSLRNNTNYMETGVLEALHLTATNKERILEQYWTKARNALEKGRTRKPFAYVVPADQPRKADVAYMLDLLRRHGIELNRAEEDAAYGDVEVHEGDYVIRMDQPSRNFILTLMSVQDFPEDAPTPYDDVAWTFPLFFNVTVEAVDTAAVQSLDMAPVTDPIRIAGEVRGEDDPAAWAVVPQASAHAIVARYALRDVPMDAAETQIVVDEDTIPPGAWLIDPDVLPAERARAWAERYGLELVGLEEDAIADVPRHALDLPRIAILHTWRSTQDEGWVRYAFDRLGIPYTYIAEDRLAGATLRDRFDVILFPNQGGSAKSIFEGVDPKYSPLPYTRTPEYPSLGFPDSTDDMTGGMGYEGLAALRDFIHAGGTFIALGSASAFAAEFGLVRHVSTRDPNGLFVPGSIVRGVVAQRKHPLVYGYADAIPLYHRFGPYLAVDDEIEGSVIVRYAERASDVLMSGMARNARGMASGPAVVSVPVGSGNVVLFGFDPLHRFQTHGDFALVWNAILNWDDLDVGLGADAPEATVAAEQP
ncbi:MAG TPA: M14 family zinc carboxypeptidase [Longimicrobiales bacterium]